MTKDNLEICPKCGGDAAYTTKLNATAKSYFCFGCGFESNDLMVIREFDFEQYEETLPELYKDIKTDDGSGRIWYPITINIEDKGTVFAKGTSLADWMWAGIKVKEVSKEEQEKAETASLLTARYLWNFLSGMSSKHNLQVAA